MRNISRIIGTYSSGIKGALLFITAGIHGNEPAGIFALQKVFTLLNRKQPRIKGKVVGCSGNRKALTQNIRYIDEDLNRTWTRKNISSKSEDSHEKKEMFNIIKELKKYLEKGFERQYFLDCHTTSANSKPYISVQDKGANKAWAKRFPSIVVQGLSDIVKGCIDNYESQIGLTGFVFEAGQHHSQKAVSNHERMIWLTLQKACGLKLEDLENNTKLTNYFERKKENQKIFQIKYRHSLNTEDTFKMEPGFINFQAVKKGQLLAYQNNRPIYSKWNAYIFMPLYQDQGDDGFFIIEEVGTKPS